MSNREKIFTPISNSLEQDLEEDFDLIIENVPPDDFVDKNSKISNLDECPSSSSSDWEIPLDTQMPLKDSQTDYDEKEWSKDTDETDRLRILRQRHIQYENEKNYDYENELFGASFFSDLSTEKSLEESTLLLNNSIDSDCDKKINFLKDLHKFRKRFHHSPEREIKLINSKRRKRSYSYSPSHIYNNNHLNRTQSCYNFDY